MPLTHDQVLREALARARRYVFGRTERVAGERRGRAREELGASSFFAPGTAGSRSSPARPMSLVVGPRVRDGEERDELCVRMLVPEKHAPKVLHAAGLKPVPSTFHGVSSDVAAFAEPPVTLGIADPVAHFAFGYPGSATTCIQAHGNSWLVGCSHVLAPQSMEPQQGDTIISGEAPVATLWSWTPVEYGSEGIEVDVALCHLNPAIEPQECWPDGSEVAGQGDLEDAVPPLLLFGWRHRGVQVQCTGKLAHPRLELDAGMTVGYANQFILTSPDGKPIVDFGDSGAAVRDSAGKLVGMVIGKSDDGLQAYCTPWGRVQQAIDEIL